MKPRTAHKLVVPALTVATAFTIGLAATRAQAGHGEVCLRPDTVTTLASRSTQIVLASKYTSTDPELAEDENNTAMLDALVADCLENGMHVEGGAYIVDPTYT